MINPFNQQIVARTYGQECPSTKCKKLRMLGHVSIEAFIKACKNTNCDCQGVFFFVCLFACLFTGLLRLFLRYEMLIMTLKSV